MKVLALLAVLAIASCSVAPFYVSHAAAPDAAGREMHTCPGFDCAEGYACTRHGCEWCGPGATRCTNGND